jgi:membrane-bound lytic murein transglycosylase D
MIAFIESAFLPHARSPKAAHGIWQFMPRTGRQYGLKSNGIVDERSDPEKATRAAARYLTYLHDLFDDWYLVMAAYKRRRGKILRAMQRTGARDFWQLAQTNAIRNQTKNYVPASWRRC